MEAPLSICTKEEMRGVIRFLFAEGFKPVEIIRGMQPQYGDNCLSRSKIYEWIDHSKKGRTSVYATRRNQEGRHRQGLRTILKLLKEQYGKTDESQWTILRRLPYVWSNERSSKRKEIFHPMEKSLARCKNWLKTQPKHFLLVE
jgi:hypothetical protein